MFLFGSKGTPKVKIRYYTKRLFQSLDESRGKELLRNQLVSVTTMLKLSRSWQDQSLMDLPKPKLPIKLTRDSGQDLFMTINELAEKASFGQLLGAVTKAGKPE